MAAWHYLNSMPWSSRPRQYAVWSFSPCEWVSVSLMFHDGRKGWLHMVIPYFQGLKSVLTPHWASAPSDAHTEQVLSQMLTGLCQQKINAFSSFKTYTSYQTHISHSFLTWWTNTMWSHGPPYVESISTTFISTDAHTSHILLPMPFSHVSLCLLTTLSIILPTCRYIYLALIVEARLYLQSSV